MRCPKCGKTFDDNSTFCNSCGTKLVEDTTEPVSIENTSSSTSFAEQLKNSINEHATDQQFDIYEEPDIDEELAETTPKKKKKGNSKLLIVFVLIFALGIGLFSFIGPKIAEDTKIKEAPKEDVFSKLHLTYSGCSDFARLEMKYDGDGIVHFTPSEDTNISNGDTIIVTVDMNSESDFLEQNGFLPETYEKKYTVSGLLEYFHTFVEMPDELKSYLSGRADEVAKESLGFLYTDETLTLVGKYVTYNKNPDELYLAQNEIGYVYNLIGNKTTGDKGPVNQYIGVIFTDIISQDSLTYDTSDIDYPVVKGVLYESYDTLQDYQEQLVYNTDDFVTEWVNN